MNDDGVTRVLHAASTAAAKDPARSNPKEAPDKGEADPRKTPKKGPKRS
jgi:hypothetical protein